MYCAWECVCVYVQFRKRYVVTLRRGGCEREWEGMRDWVIEVGSVTTLKERECVGGDWEEKIECLCLRNRDSVQLKEWGRDKERERERVFLVKFRREQVNAFFDSRISASQSEKRRWIGKRRQQNVLIKCRFWDVVFEPSLIQKQSC